MIRLIATAFICSLIPASVIANDLVFGYKNPSFHSGNGYSNHVLSVEQLRFSREKDIKEKKEQEQKEAEREATQNTVKKLDDAQNDKWKLLRKLGDNKSLHERTLALSEEKEILVQDIHQKIIELKKEKSSV